MKKLYALTMLFSVSSLQASDPLTALVQAIEARNLNRVTAAIKKAKNANVLNEPYSLCRSTVLHLAAKKFPSAVPLLIKEESDVHAKDANGETPLHCTQDPAAIRALVDAGVSVNARSHDGWTRLHTISHYDSAKTLLYLGANPNTKNSVGATPLHYACTAEIAQLLIDKGADPRATSTFGFTPLHCAVSFQHLDVIALLTPLSDLEKRCTSGRTALHRAANYPQHTPRQDQKRIVHILLEKGADINARVQKAEKSIESELGNTPLHCAAQSGNTDVVRLLLRCTSTRNPCKQTQAPKEEEKE